MVGRMWDRVRGIRPLVDAFLAFPLVLSSLTGLLGSGFGMSDPEYLAWTAALVGPLALRRTFPRSVFAAVALLSAVQWALDVPPLPGNLGVLMGLYTIAATFPGLWTWAALAVTGLGAVMAAFGYAEGVRDQRYALMMMAILVAGVWLLGLHMRTRRAYLRSVEERAARLERERDSEVRVARAAERARIARELHDVVAHNVSVIVVQADGASYAIETDTGRARQALETISVTGRQALAEMRRLLGVLREGDDAAGPDGGYAPQPGVGQLRDLVEQVRASGLPLELAVDGDPPELSEGRGLTLYRIAQEALTNILKHAGPGASARVGLVYRPDEVALTVTDDGRGAAALDDGRGHGLAGMRERAAVYGGTVGSGPRPGGGFQVTARIPVRDAVGAGHRAPSG